MIHTHSQQQPKNGQTTVFIRNEWNNRFSCSFSSRLQFCVPASRMIHLTGSELRDSTTFSRSVSMIPFISVLEMMLQRNCRNVGECRWIRRCDDVTRAPPEVNGATLPVTRLNQEMNPLHYQFCPKPAGSMNVQSNVTPESNYNFIRLEKWRANWWRSS